MRALVQKVKKASVTVDGNLISSVNQGLLVFIGFGKEDQERDMDYLADKIIGLRVFPDGEKDSALSVKDIGGEILFISQFTLFGDVKKGKRPSFSDAMPSELARVAYEKMAEKMNNLGVITKLGIFQAVMDVELINDGPYTIWLDSRR